MDVCCSPGLRSGKRDSVVDKSSVVRDHVPTFSIEQLGRLLPRRRPNTFQFWRSGPSQAYGRRRSTNFDGRTSIFRNARSVSMRVQRKRGRKGSLRFRKSPGVASTLRQPSRFCGSAQPSEDPTRYDEGRWHRRVAAGRVTSFLCQRALRFSQESGSNRAATRPPRPGHVADSLPRSDEAERSSSVLDHCPSGSSGKHRAYEQIARSKQCIRMKNELHQHTDRATRGKSASNTG